VHLRTDPQTGRTLEARLVPFIITVEESRPPERKRNTISRLASFQVEELGRLMMKRFQQCARPRQSFCKGRSKDSTGFIDAGKLFFSGRLARRSFLADFARRHINA
jgi:hypothetical protein